MPNINHFYELSFETKIKFIGYTIEEIWPGEKNTPKKNAVQLLIEQIYFSLQAFGFAEVEQLYGMDTVRDAAYQLKNLYGGKGKMKLKLFISIKGIKLYHVQTLVSIMGYVPVDFLF